VGAPRNSVPPRRVFSHGSSETDRIAPAGPPAVTPSLDRRNRRRRAVWYSILCLLIAAGLTLPFVFMS
jgi:hypothetical protein